MRKTYDKYAEMFRALGDTNRLLILEMLCKDERCACKILEKFNITQPTLSHHMKILCDCGIVNRRKEGKWMHYSININGCKKTMRLLKNFTTVVANNCSGNSKGCKSE